MNGILLIAHTPLASALRDCALHVFPDCASGVQAIDVVADEDPQQVIRRARAAMQQMQAEGVLLLTDVFGATPCNVAQRLTDHRRIRVVTGVNVPMLWRVLCYEQESAERLAERAVSGATQGVMPVEARAPQFQELRVHHGQDRHHDQ